MTWHCHQAILSALTFRFRYLKVSVFYLVGLAPMWLGLLRAACLVHLCISCANRHSNDCKHLRNNMVSPLRNLVPIYFLGFGILKLQYYELTLKWTSLHWNFGPPKTYIHSWCSWAKLPVIKIIGCCRLLVIISLHPNDFVNSFTYGQWFSQRFSKK